MSLQTAGDSNQGNELAEDLTAEQWRDIKAIVAEALEIESAPDRAALVKLRCSGDAALMREVESLLAQTTSPMEQYAASTVTAVRSDAPTLATGLRIGAYAIIRELGRGGMGAVYLAARADREFEKEVAIKLLKRGTDTDEVLRRFRAEREILARLEHPNIARLIDAGTTGDGLPYFVMEYVVGAPVTQFCCANKLSIEERLRLFLKICAAVQFAHQNLIVHRDLKPANILVTSDGEPKLLDFGIAKLLAHDDITPTLTLPDQQRLTAGYASPEQVRGEPITTVSDVYALGALLYQIISEQPAHRFAHAHPSPTELLQVIGEQTPLRPSASVTDPQLGRQLRGDLDNIVLQALRKEPARRYPGVNSLAEDIRRYLRHFPVRARKDTLGYRTTKFVRRNRIAVAAALLVLLALLGGLGATAWQTHVARQERAKAVQRFNQVRALAHSVLFDYHDAIAALPGSTAVRERLVRDALKYLDNLSKEVGDNRALLRELADAYEKVAAVQGGAASSNRGTTITASNLGDTQGALASEAKAISIREMLAKSSQSNQTDLQALATSYTVMEGLYVLSGPPEKTVEYFRKASPLTESLLATNPGSEELQYLASSNYSGMAKALGDPGVPNLGDTKGAVEYMRKALAADERLATDHPDNLAYRQGLGTSHNALGLLFSATGDRNAQLDEYQKALAIDRELVAANPANAFYRRELAVQLGNVGSTMVQLKDKTGALEYFRQALAIYESLVAADPSDVSIRRQLAVGYRNVGVGVGATNRPEASTSFQKATGILAELVAKDPRNGDFRRQLAYTYLATSRYELELDDLPAAVSSASEGIKVAEALVASSPANVSAQNTLALLYSQLGASESKSGARLTPTEPGRKEHWLRAKEAFGKSLGIYSAMKAQGTLNAADAGKLDEVSQEIRKCDVAVDNL